MRDLPLARCGTPVQPNPPMHRTLAPLPMTRPLNSDLSYSELFRVEQARAEKRCKKKSEKVCWYFDVTIQVWMHCDKFP